MRWATTPVADQVPASNLPRVVIAGGGSAGWMAATYLGRALGRHADITLVESEAIGIVGVGEATIPPIRQFNNFCGIDERAFIKATKGTFKLGIQFEGWGASGDRYIHAFGRVGQELDAIVRMHHWWLHGRSAAAQDYPAFEDLFLARAATDRQAFALDPRAAGDRSALLPHAYHFDATEYGRFLRVIAEERGVKRIEGTIASVERDGASGDVTCVRLDDDRMIGGDLFVDCSGFRSLLLGDAMGEGFDDWSQWLPADRAVVVQSDARDNAITPATRAIAHSVGWQWRIPLQDRIGNGHVYSSAFSNDEDAQKRLLSTIDGPAKGDTRVLKFKTGRRQRHWVGNVVGMGLSTGFLEPLESTSIHLVQSALERLVELFPARAITPALRDRFNEQSVHEWEQVRDLIIAHYKVTQRGDSAFWQHCRAMDVPDSLSATLSLWEESGALAIDGGHLFQLGSWASVLIGQNLIPGAAHPLTARASAQDIAPRIVSLAAGLRQQAEKLPDHAQFIGRYVANG